MYIRYELMIALTICMIIMIIMIIGIPSDNWKIRGGTRLPSQRKGGESGDRHITR